MAELDAVVKDFNLALALQMKDVKLLTDSVTVHRWIPDSVSGKRKLKTRAASEMSIRSESA